MINRRSSPPGDELPGPPRRTALVALAAALGALYGATLCPTIYSGDAAELATAASTFGIAHPPGYPLYALLGNLWARALPIGELAWRVNLLSCCAAVGAALLLALALIRLRVGVAAASFAALSLGAGLTFWSQALISEVYAFDMLLVALTLQVAARSRTAPTLRQAALVLLCAGLWVGHRPVNAIYLPAVAGLAWPALRCCVRSPRAVAWSAAALLPAALVLLYLPWASAAEPLLDTGDPETWSRFFALISAQAYGHYLAAPSLGELGRIIAALPRELGVALLLAPLGLVVAWRSERHVALVLGYLAAAGLVFASSYRVPDVTVFTLPAVFALAGLAAFGARALLAALGRVAPAFVGPLLLLCGVLLLGAVNFRDNDLRGQTLARDFARDALELAGDRGLVISHVDTVSFSLWYAQAVERRRPDVLVVSRGRAVDWHQEQARRLRPDLDVPRYDGPDPASRWPALLALGNADKVDVFVTADLAGSFSPADAQGVAARLVEVPAGLLTRLAARERATDAERIAQRNAAFWQRAWPHATRARRQTLSTELAALLLHYASKRVLLARYCLWHGLGRCAKEAARAVVALDPAPVIAAVNAQYARHGQRYHLSQMPELAQGLAQLAEALLRGAVSLVEVRGRLAGAPAPPPPVDAVVTPTDARAIDALNQQGIALAQQGVLDASLVRFDAVLRAQPGHVGALFNRAKVLAMLGRTDEATAAYEALLRRASGSAAGLVGLAELKRDRDPPAAAALYRRALAGDGPAALHALARQRLAELAAAR
jgi:tetratricopeptide (TPR) repeat protein